MLISPCLDPTEIVPATHKKAPRAARPGQPAQGAGRPDGAYRAPRGGDEGYRRRDDGEGKKDQAPSGDFRPRYVVSFICNCLCSFVAAASVAEELDEEPLRPKQMYLEMSASAYFIADLKRNLSAFDFPTFSIYIYPGCALYVKQQLMSPAFLSLRMGVESIGRSLFG